MIKLSQKDASCTDLSFSSDGFRLSGTLHLPGMPLPPIVVGSHGLLSSGSSPKQIELARQCSENGMAFFRFDHRGCGHSDGGKADAADFKDVAGTFSARLTFCETLTALVL